VSQQLISFSFIIFFKRRLFCILAALFGSGTISSLSTLKYHHFQDTLYCIGFIFLGITFSLYGGRDSEGNVIKKRKPAQEWTSPYKPYHHENTNVGHNPVSANKDI
jgi:hypothetical protein